MKRFVFMLLSLFVCFSWAWADTSYSGYFSLNGQMGEGITFRIDAAYWGDGPCLVAGRTNYMRKNGKESQIKLYGMLDGDDCTLYEFVENRVCGRFVLRNLPTADDLSNFKLVDGTTIEGAWDYKGRSYEFGHVTLEQYADVDYGQLLKHPDWNWQLLSGEYGYCWDTGEGMDEGTLRMIVTPDSVTWKFSFNNEVLGESGEFETVTHGYGRVPDMHEDCFVVEVDGGVYRIEPMDDVLMVSRENELPESDDFIDLRGIYPRMSDYVYYYEEQKVSETIPDAAIHATAELVVPRTDSRQLNDSIRRWVTSCCGGSPKESYLDMARSSVQNFLNGDDVNSDEIDPVTELLPFNDCRIGYGCYNEKKFINLWSSDYVYLGGMNGMMVFETATLRRSDGKVMRWNDWFIDSEKVRPIIEKHMRQENDEVEFFDETLLLPQNAPYLEGGKLHFEYQQYESAPYVYGTPSCAVPVNELLPYMTPAGKALTK